MFIGFESKNDLLINSKINSSIGKIFDCRGLKNLFKLLIKQRQLSIIFIRQFMKQLSHQDADLVLKLYEIRREPVMRASRDMIVGKFWPKSYAEIEEILKPEHPFNAAYRQVSSYWEMTYNFARRGIIDPDFLIENNGEGLFVFAKFYKFIAEIRKNYNPLSFSNAEWIATECEEGKRRFEMIKTRIEKLTAQK